MFGSELVPRFLRGPGSSTDNAIARFDGATGRKLQSSPVTMADDGTMRIPNNVSLTFLDATDTNNNSFKTADDGTFLFDIGAGNSVTIKGGDSLGVETLRYTDASFSTEWSVNTLGRTTQNGGALFNVEKQDSDFRVSGVDDTDLFHIDASTNSVLVNTGTGDGDAKFWVANGVARFDENFKFKKGSGEQVIVRQDPNTGSGGTGFDLKFEAGNADMMNMRGSGKLEFGNGSLSGGIVFNENGNDTDIRFEGDNDANLLSLDAGLDAIGVGVLSPNAAAKFQIDSTTKGFLPPRMTTTQRDNIGTPPAGLLIYNTTTNKLNVYTTAWEAVTSA